MAKHRNPPKKRVGVVGVFSDILVAFFFFFHIYHLPSDKYQYKEKPLKHRKRLGLG